MNAKSLYYFKYNKKIITCAHIFVSKLNQIKQ